MECIKVQVQKHIATITLHRPKSNAINLKMIDELIDIFGHIQKDSQIAGVLLTGQGHFFSAGLDLIEMYNLDETEIRHFFIRFMELTHCMVSFSKPLVAAINGHSPAGGCVMALASDVRLMSEGEFKIGLNEIPVGIIVPHSIFQLYASTLGTAPASKYLLQGKLFSPQEALQVGLIDVLVTTENIITQAQRTIEKLVQLESNTWQKSKLNIRQELIKHFEKQDDKTLDEILEQWWNPKTRSILKTIIQNLTQKSN